jgi:hypothetical protein
MTLTRGDRRGQHPDLDEAGQLKPDVLYDIGASPRERDLNRTLSDPAGRERFVNQAAAEQRELPVEVQRYIQGRVFGGAPAEGYRQYEQERAWALQEWGRRQGYERVVTDADVSRMSLEEYDQHFDEKGRPKPGVVLWRTSRSQRLDDTMDAASQSELRYIRGGPRR